MVDSDDDCDTWRSRDKYPKEREASPFEQRNDKRPFNNFNSPVKNTEPPFKRFRRDNDDFNNYSNFNNRRNPMDDVAKQLPPKSMDDAPNYPTQPLMLQFKSFLQQQDDDIGMDDAMKKYNDYKDMFVRKQLRAFFDSHSSQEWFKEKYYPNIMEKRRELNLKNIIKRKDIFQFLNEKKWMENVKLHYDQNEEIVRLMDAVVIMLEGGDEFDLKILDSRRYRSESPNEPRIVLEKKETEEIESVVESDKDTKVDNEDTKEIVQPTVTENNETKDTKDEEESKEVKEPDEKPREPRALHKTFSIFLRNLHPNVLRSEIEALVKPYDGFLRLALQDPTPDRKFFRRGWVTYDCSVNIKEICWNLNNIRLHDCDIGAIVNRELTQRVRHVSYLANHKPVMRQDIKIAAKLVAKFDKRYGLWQREDISDTTGIGNPLGSENPLLRNITEYLVDEGSYEEEALLGGNLNTNLELTSSGDPSNVKIDTDEILAGVLDKLIFYLRFVHSFDYYSITEYQIEDEMPHRCGIMHARGTNPSSDKAISQKEVEEFIATTEIKAEQLLSTVDRIIVEDARKLGYMDADTAAEQFMQDNTQMLADDKWLCPLSGKKFKGPEFVRKHILNKHSERLDEMKLTSVYFNNYLLDAKRPQLPEHAGNRPGAKLGSDFNGREEGQTDMGRPDNRNGPRNYDMRGGRNRDDFERRNNFRGDRRSPNNCRNNYEGGRGGNSYDGARGGNSYRNNYQGRGGGGRQRNGGGSYYSRKMMSYNDLDAPNDE